MKPVIYQIIVRLAGNPKNTGKLFGTIDENGCGKFNDLSLHFLKAIREFGATHIWLTGVISHATCTDYSAYGLPASHPAIVKGRAGSPYAIRDYYDVDPDLAVEVKSRMQEFEALIQRCIKAGIDPIIDFVPNHVAREYHSKALPEDATELGAEDKTGFAFHPENNFLYIPGQRLRLPDGVWQLPYVKETDAGPFVEDPAKVTGNDQFSASPDINDWYETVKLNYGLDYSGKVTKHFDPIPDTWEKMLNILFFWSGKGVKGFRCDMAEMVPVEFWEWAIARVKTTYPKTLFIAEIYNPSSYRLYYERGGFDFLYDKEGLYNTLREVICGNRPAVLISKVWQELNGLDAYMLRFLENHDEQRIASPHFAGDASAGIAGMAVASMMHQGPLMIYFGQELGENAAEPSGYSGNDGKTTLFDYFHVPAFQQWFNKGKCDGRYLDSQQISLREEYKKLFLLAQDPMITQGNFYDLTWFNREKTDFDEQYLYAFLRWYKNEAWLVVSNFNRSHTIEANIRIPGHFLDLLEFNHGDALFLNTIHGIQNIPKELSREQAKEDGIPLEINQSGYVVLKITLA